MPERGAFLPFTEMLAENAGRPYGCFNYDTQSETCEAVERTTLSGDRWRGQGVAATFLGNEVVHFNVRAQGTVENGLQCMDARDYSISIPRLEGFAGEREFVGLLEAAFAMMGSFCSSYYRMGDGVYYTESTRPDGSVIPDTEGTIRFFAEQPRLRVVGE